MLFFLNRPFRILRHSLACAKCYKRRIIDSNYDNDSGKCVHSYIFEIEMEHVKIET